MKLKSRLKRTLVLTMVAVTVALTFLQPFSAVENKPKKYLKDVTINEFFADLWLGNVNYYHDSYTGGGFNIQYYETNDGYTQILADSIRADKSLLKEISIWEDMALFEDIGGSAYDQLTPTSRYEIILMEMLRQLMKNQDIKENLSAKGSEISAGLIELFKARLSHMDVSADEKIDQGMFIEAQNGIQTFFENIEPLLDSGVTATEIGKMAKIQSVCVELWGEVDYEWIVESINWFEGNIPFYMNSKKICDSIEVGNLLLDQFFAVQDLLEKMGTYFELQNLNSQYIDYLYALESYCDIESEGDLKNAINKVITCITSTTALYDTLISDMILREATEMFEIVWDGIVLKTIETICPWMKALNLAYDATIKILNISFGTSENIESVYTLLGFAELLRVVQRTSFELRRAYMRNENAENAALFVAGVDALFAMQMMDCSYAEEYINDITTNGVLTQLLLSRESKETFREMLDIYKDTEILREERFNMMYFGVMGLYDALWEEQEIILKDLEEEEKRREELEEQIRKWMEEQNKILQNSQGMPVAGGKCGYNVNWALYKDGRLIISGDGDMYDYTYSSHAPWYDYKSDIKTVIISDGVTSIGARAFYDCSRLTSVTIGDSVTSIGNGAFSSCYSLTSVTIGDSVTSIGNYAFNGCSKLTSVTIGDSVTSIGNYAFNGCSKLTSVTIGDSVTSIGNGAFASCSSLTSVTIPDSVTSIGEDAFYNCSNLTSVEIGDSVTSIGDWAFSSCDSLTNLYISDLDSWLNVSLSNYSSHPLYSAGGNLYIDGVLATDIEIPDSVTSIGYNAFRNCSSLTSVTIPDSVTSIGSYAFEDCGNLKNLYISDLESWLNVKLDSSSSHPLYSPGGNLYIDGVLATDIVIPNSVTSIGGDAFRNCSSLTSVEIGDNVTSIGDSAFYWCSSLAIVEIGDSVTSIGEDVFRNCSSLTSVEIGDNVTSIGDSAFNGCDALTSVEIGDGVTSIGDGAFYYCESLTSVEIGDNVTSIGGHAFHGCSKLTSIEIPDSVTSIGDGAFYYCESLTSVEIGDSVKVVGGGAFYGCTSIESVYYTSDLAGWCNISFPDGNHEIFDTIRVFSSPLHNGADLYINNVLLENAIIPDSVSSIKNSAFNGCRSLKIVTIPNSVTSIGEDAFRNCSSLTRVTFETKNVTIDSDAFDYCNNLKTIYCYKNSTADEYFSSDKYTKNYLDENITAPETDFKYSVNDDGVSVTITQYAGAGGEVIIPSKIAGYTVTIIGDGAFLWCNNLISVVVPDSVTYIGHFAFDNEDLTTVTIGKGLSSIGNFIFCGEGKIKAIEVVDDNEYFCDIDGVLFTKDKKTIVAFPGGKATTYTIPYGVTEIRSRSFASCSNLEKLIIPDTVTKIGDYVFVECYSLSDLQIPNSVKTIGIEAFRNCDSFQKITIPSSVAGLDVRAFRNCDSLEQVTFKNRATNIGANSFDGCTSLKTIYCPQNSTADEYFSEETFDKIWITDTIPGDSNGDGDINAKDAVLLAQHLAGWTVNIDESAADCNGDGDINAKDAVLLAQHLAGWSVTLG